MEYRHTQWGKTAVFVLLWGLLIVLIAAVASDDEGGTVAATVVITTIISAVVFMFGRLTVVVAAETVSVSFGYGWPRRTFAIGEIAGFRQVRNKWYYGWGVRRVPGGWMYNVWGLDAVELELSSGKKFRIGTDEASDLIAALSQHTNLPPNRGD